MREIKFEYILDNHNGGTFKQIFTLEEMEETQSIFYNYPVIARRQYTGLKDKNGNEIYEGDIIEYNSKIYEIKYNQLHCCFGFYEFSGFQGELIGNAFPEFGDIEQTDYIIIGNIYENKELLK